MPRLSYSAPREADLTAVVALLNACDIAETGRPDTDQSDVIADWREGGFVLEEDALLASEEIAGEQTVVGYSVLLDDYVQVAVHPERCGHGIGTSLREFAERRALDRLGSRAEAEVKVWQAPRKTNADAHLLLEQAGYTRGHHYARMEREIAEGLKAAARPPGVTIRTFEAGRDERAMHALQNRAWVEYPTAPQLSYERWAEVLQDPAFDPELWYIAEEDGEGVGTCRCRRTGDKAYVAMIGVDPGRRGRGLGEALLRHALAQLAARGVRLATLNVSSRNSQAAWSLYARVGFRETGGWIAYEKTLPRAG